MKYKIGQSVRVKQGILCPDAEEFDLSGWQGRVIGFEKDCDGTPTVGIAWDSVTLRQMPEEYIEDGEENGLGWWEMFLYPEEIEPEELRDFEKDVARIREQLEEQFRWIWMGEQGRRIRAVIRSAKTASEWEIMKAWESHLEQTLIFPFQAYVTEDYRGPLASYKDKLKVMGIELVDDLYGLIASCRLGRKRYDCPLADLDVVEKTSKNAQPL